MKILIIGGGGQLGTALVTLLTPDHGVVAPARSELDVTSAEHRDHWMRVAEPDVVINTAAFHQVDLCETEPESSFAMNAAAPQRLAALCREAGALLVHISTDYVFDGMQSTPYEEGHPVSPLNTYGASKAAGEMAIRAVTPHHLIVRTTGLYGPAAHGRGNFVETMLRLARAGSEIAVVGDQVLTPTSAADCAEVIARLITVAARGTVHVTNGGECSWCEFAIEIFRLAGLSPSVSRVSQEARPLPARRPAYSVLGHQRLQEYQIREPRDWRDALADYLQSRGDHL